MLKSLSRFILVMAILFSVAACQRPITTENDATEKRSTKLDATSNIDDPTSETEIVDAPEVLVAQEAPGLTTKSDTTSNMDIGKSEPEFAYTPKVIVAQAAPGLMIVTPKLAVVDGLYLTITFIIPKPEDDIQFRLGGLAGSIIIENDVEIEDFRLSSSTKLKLRAGNREFQLSSPRRDDVNVTVTGLVCDRFRARELHNFLTTDDALSLEIDGKHFPLAKGMVKCLRDLVSKTADRL